MLCLLLAATLAADPAPVVVEIDAGRHERINTPVTFPLPPSFENTGTVGLVALKTDSPVRAQVAGHDPHAVIAIISIPAGEKRRYRLTATPFDSITTRLSLADGPDKTSVVLGENGAPILAYQKTIAEPPEGVDRVYRRSGFIHPLATPSGRVVTNDFALDHPHQHGLFFAWTKSSFRGKPMNFWDQLQKTARVVHDRKLIATDGPAAIQLGFRIGHEDITGGEGKPVRVLDETWRLTAFEHDGPNLIDFESTQNASGPDPLVLSQYIYGGFGLRGNPAWSDPQAKGEDAPEPSRSGESEFLTSDGKTRANGNHTRPRWVDLYGKVNGAFAGVAVLQHPSNFRFPQPVRLHPNMPYFSVAPAVLGGFEIKQGTPYVSKYRIVVHDGKPDPRTIDRLWNDYAEPPTVTVVKGD